jgi:hypothetical protein
MKQMIKKHGSNLVAAIMLIVMMFSVMPAPQAASALAACDMAQFVADVTVPDGTLYSPSATFNKVWRLKNVGTCTWTTGYKLVFVGGSQMGATASAALPTSVYPGQTVDLTVAMTAPSTAGTYRGDWMLQSASSVNFGIGAYANKAFWVEIRVSGGSVSTGYDFYTNASSAVWTSGAGSVTLNGTDPNTNGVAKAVAAPVLENNTVDGPGLVTVPQNVYNGYVQGVYPDILVNSGDRFQSIVNCEYGATGCFVNFKLKYQIGGGAVQTLWSYAEAYEGLYYRANVDLSSLAGQTVKFILFVDTAGYATGDRPLWASPRIVSGSGSYPPPPPPVYPPYGGTCDKAAFISDVNYPDGTNVAAGTAFTKTWRIKNIGSCTWTNQYSLIYVSGSQMGGSSPIALTSTVGPNTSFDVSVNLVAPSTAGNYRGYWMLKNQYSQAFGIGYAGDKAWWVEINSVGSSPAPTATPVPTATPGSGTGVFNGDFTIDPDLAAWSDSVGTITLGGTASAGTVAKLTGISGVQGTKMEDETTSYQNSLLFMPNTSGYVRGIYPNYTVQSGDIFKATIGCQFGASACDVKYKVGYKVGGTITYFADEFNEAYDGMTRNISISLNPIAGQTVQLVIEVLSNGANTDDEAIWLAPRVE